MPDALNAEAMRKVGVVLAAPSPPGGAGAFYWHVLRGEAPFPPGGDLRQLEPWMAFFHIWTEYRRRDGWKSCIAAD